jgi:hypothetical protein
VTAAVRLALFAVVLVVSGLLGAGLGTVVGPIDVGGGHDPAPAATVPGAPETDHGGHGSDGAEGAGADAEPDDDAGHEDGHDLDEPFEVPEIGPEDGGP